MTSVTSSPSIGSENFRNGPLTALHDENRPDAASCSGNVAGSLYTCIASGCPVIMNTP